MTHRFQFTFLLTVLLLQGCAASMGVEPTDLSGIGEGKTRAEVEAIVGTPIEQEVLSFGTAAVYQYDRGSSGVLPKDYGGCVGACAMAYMAMLPLSVLAHDEVVSDQRGHLIAVYDHIDRLSALYPDQTIDTLKSGYEGDADAQYHLALSSPFESEARAYWYCNAAHRAHADAQFMFSAYPNPEQPLYPRTNVERYMWLRLAASQGNINAELFRENLIQKMPAQEVTEGDALAATWKPDLSKCETAASPNS